MAGMGCNKGTPVEEILELVNHTFVRFNLSLHSLHTLATIAAKKTEKGFMAAAQHLGVDFLWFSKEELEQIPVPNPSATVQRHMGVASVCEAAALKAAGAGTLLVPKQKTANVTLAVAQAG
jgi:cobalt-precorrin 5A hydrolase